VMAEPWTDRRKRLEEMSAGLDSARVAVVPVAEDAAHLWPVPRQNDVGPPFVGSQTSQGSQPTQD